MFRLKLAFELGSARMVFHTPTVAEREGMRDEIAQIFPKDGAEVDEERAGAALTRVGEILSGLLVSVSQDGVEIDNPKEVLAESGVLAGKVGLDICRDLFLVRAEIVCKGYA